MRRLALFSLLLASGCASQLQSYVDAITPEDPKTIGAGIASIVQARVAPESDPSPWKARQPMRAGTGGQIRPGTRRLQGPP